MLHAGEQSCFAFELPSRRRVGGKCFFERNRFSESLVYSFIDRSHAAAAKLTDDAVALLQDLVGN